MNRACLHEGGGPQVGEVTCGGLPHLSGLPRLPVVPQLHVKKP